MSGNSEAGSRIAIGFWEVLAFGCEMAMLAALAVIGWLLAPTTSTAVAAAFALPALLGLAWGLWLAPRARRRLRGPTLTLAKIAVFVATGAALAATGRPGWGTTLTAVSVVDALMLSRRDALTARR